jgi:predicted XRE-type DNA-binding protein
MSKNKKVDYELTEDNVFSAHERDKPDRLIVKAKLLDKVSTLIKNSKLSKREVAKKLGIIQPKVSMLIGGRLSVFSMRYFASLSFYSWM